MKLRVTVVKFLLAIVLAISLLTTGCNVSSLTKLGSAGDTNKANLPLSKVKIDEWETSLPVNTLSIYPNSGKLARVYAKIENKSKKELEVVKLVAISGDDKKVGRTTIVDLKPGEVRTFEIQTSQYISDFAKKSAVKVEGLRIKGE